MSEEENPSGFGIGLSTAEFTACGLKSLDQLAPTVPGNRVRLYLERAEGLNQCRGRMKREAGSGSCVATLPVGVTVSHVRNGAYEVIEGVRQ